MPCFVMLICFGKSSLASSPNCIQDFLALGRLSEKVLDAVPSQYREAVLASLEKQYSSIADGLTEAERVQMASTLRNFKNSDKTIAVARDGSEFEVPEEVLDLPLSALFVIHEAQHLRDIIRPPSSLARAASFTKKMETRAYLRQRALLLDVKHSIGIEGITEIVMQGARLKAEHRNALRSAIETLVGRPGDSGLTPSTLGDFARSQFGEENAERLGMPFSHLMNIKDKRAYVQGFLDDPTYAFKIAAEEDPDFIRKLEAYAAYLQNQDKNRNRDRLLNAAVALGASLNAYLFYQVFFASRAQKPAQ